MNDFVRCNKLTGVYWLQGPLDQLRIKIKLKPPDDIISLPKFEESTNETGSSSLQRNIEEFSFRWQEKCFSLWEVERYRDVHKCLTERERGYHELVRGEGVAPGNVFTYIHEDYYMPLPRGKTERASELTSCLERLRVEGAVGGAAEGAVGTIGRDMGGKSASARHLLKSHENIREEEERWTAMHVVLDYSDYNDERVVVKREAPLVSVFLNTRRRYLTVTPDANRLETDPYVAEDGAPLPHSYLYGVTLELGPAAATSAPRELHASLLKLHKKWQKKHKQIVKFVSPPLGSAHYYVTVELVSARGFQADNLYIEYHIKLAENTRCEDALRGRTHLSEPSEVDAVDVFHFGHTIELHLEIHSEKEPGPVTVYLECISREWWRQRRTRGYSRLALSLRAGARRRALRCVRPDEPGADERMFFLGGCHLIEDLEVLSRPELQNGDYTYSEAGSILVRTGIVSQPALPGAGARIGARCAGPGPGPAAPGASSTAALLRGAEAALRKYSRARDRLARASTAGDTH